MLSKASFLLKIDVVSDYFTLCPSHGADRRDAIRDPRSEYLVAVARLVSTVSTTSRMIDSTALVDAGVLTYSAPVSVVRSNLLQGLPIYAVLL